MLLLWMMIVSVFVIYILSILPWLDVTIVDDDSKCVCYIYIYPSFHV